jgi:hypothetical protein
MKILIVAYVNSDKLLTQIDGIMSYDKFQTTETNNHFRVFSGDFNEHPVAYFKKLYQQLEDMDFNVEDSIFMVYPNFPRAKSLTISTLVLKRKGNKYLRKQDERV